jgi:DNA-binding SARP family transcriptional activator
MGLEISLLGPPEVAVDGAPLSVDTRKAVALLARLAVTGRPEAREQVAVLLWPDQDDAHSRSALRRTLSTLRTALDGRWVTTAGATVGLDRDGCTVDVDVFRAAVASCGAHGHGANDTCGRCVEALRRATGLARGEFMAGFALRDSPEFDDWQRFQAEGLAREVAAALERLVEACAAEGLRDEAVSHARQLLELDPLREPVHRRLMSLYAMAGDRSAAVEQYRECVRVLDRELGVAPLEETTELYRAIVEGRVGPEPAPAASDAAVESNVPRAVVAPERPAELPLVGRNGDLDEARRAIADGVRDGHLLVVEGEAGIGKTRLVREALRSLANGAPVVEVRCFQGEAGMAYAPVAAALRAAATIAPDAWNQVAPQFRHEAARLVPELPAPGPEPPALDGPGAQTRFVEGLVRTLVGALGGGGVVVVDDAQWADPSSVDLLTFLARRLRGTGLAGVLTWRTEDVEPDDPLRRLAAGAVRDGEGTVVTLRRLDLEEVDGLVTAAKGEPDPFLARRLFAETEGVPFFLHEYLSARSVSAAGPELPTGVRELLRSRVSSVGEAARQVLAAAAVLGRTFSFGLVRDTSGRSEEETLAAIEESLARGLLAEAPPTGGDPRYDFAHEKLRAVVEDDTSLARRRLLHRRAAERLSRPGAAAEAHDAAEHFLQAGMEQEAAIWFERAGRASRSVFANREAANHLLAALALGHPRQAALHEEIGDLMTLLGDYTEALLHYEAAAARGEPADLPRIEHRLGALHHRRGDFALAEEHFRAALDGSVEPAQRARVLAARSLNAHRAGDAERATALAGDAVAAAERSGDPAALAEVEAVLGILESGAGHSSAARDHLRRGLDLISPDAPGTRAGALNSLALAQLACGDPDGALERATEALDLSRAVGDRHREAAIHGNLADVLHALGREDESREHQREAASILADVAGASTGEWRPEIWKLAEW